MYNVWRLFVISLSFFRCSKKEKYEKEVERCRDHRFVIIIVSCYIFSFVICIIIYTCLRYSYHVYVVKNAFISIRFQRVYSKERSILRLISIREKVKIFLLGIEAQNSRGMIHEEKEKKTEIMQNWSDNNLTQITISPPKWNYPQLYPMILNYFDLEYIQ